MKDKRFLSNMDRDALCFVMTVFLLSGVAAVVAVADTVMRSGDAVVKEKVTDVTPCDGVCVNSQLPARTNTGDTLYVLGNYPKKNKSVYAKRPDGNTGTFVFDGADRVKPGDTIVINSKHNFLMKNITQRNLERQK